jgi:hypothetical protein
MMIRHISWSEIVMQRSRKVGLAAGLLLAAGFLATRAAEQPARTRAEFMRTKLEASSRILEGLAVEDYELILRGARSLKLLSRAAEWEVPMLPNATDYLTYTTEFQRLTDDLTRDARNRTLDGATLDYFRLTMCCVNCHKYVRSLAR